MIRDEEKNLYKILKILDINYIRYEHEAIYTIEESKNLNIKFEGQQCKNLFLKSKRGDKHYLVILDEDSRGNLKEVSKKMGVNSLSFASEERLKKYLGVEKGSVTPFGLINDINKEVIVLIDKNLNKESLISFHPNINTATISISYLDFEKFLKHQGNELMLI